MARPGPETSLTLAALAERSGAELEGDGSVRISRVGTLEHAEAGEIAFLANPKYAAQLGATRASAVIVSPADAARTALPKLVSRHPYLTYARVARLLHPEDAAPAGVHPTATVDPSARLGSGVSIGPNASVGEEAVLGDGVSIGAGCAIGRSVRIGARSRLNANVVVYDRCELGEDALVLAGAVIGSDGFGHAEDGGRWVRVPQLGRVVIGDRVEVGANTTIDRGAIDDTVIEDDVKLDNQIQVGHNCFIGAGTAIAGCVGIAGSTRIGRRCRIGGAANISGHLSIPDGTTIGGATTILWSLDEPALYSSVWPAQKYADWRRTATWLRRIAALADRVAKLERALRDRDNEG
jgi:UDP-3-O-[3-hydroxymyristoyl] glucosamine N-acyltransferase